MSLSQCRAVSVGQWGMSTNVKLDLPIVQSGIYGISLPPHHTRGLFTRQPEQSCPFLQRSQTVKITN